ncbi:MAG: hypothetical protein JNK75_13770 [Betaproteobacteria bacterium]|nr:hypothetical protein [Betaproteobacteria bacterium]
MTLLSSPSGSEHPTQSPSLDIGRLNEGSRAFLKEFRQVRTSCAPPDFPWYPWESLGNFEHLDRLLKDPHRDLARLIGGLPVADVGGADGDVSFFLERQGIEMDLVDYGPTNMNGLHGARFLKQALRSNISIHEMDLDAKFEWPRNQYGLVFFLGILYHLKNPFYVLESLAKVTRHAFISTRVAQFSPSGESIENLPVAYLVNPTECNNDPTNYWIFSGSGLARILDRAGWDVVAQMRNGNTTRSDPASAQGDERAYLLVRSRRADIG